MMFELIQPEKASALFEGWQETMVWSCLQGVMGKIYVDSLEKPASAMAVLGDFCFLAGRPEREVLLYEPVWGQREFTILVPQSREWEELVEACCEEWEGEISCSRLQRTSTLRRSAEPCRHGFVPLLRRKKIVRYAIKKEPDTFDRGLLQTIVNGLPKGYTLKMMDETLFRCCREIKWCRDWVSQYPDYAAYKRYGLGAVILRDGEPVSGASSYSGYILAGSESGDSPQVSDDGCGSQILRIPGCFRPDAPLLAAGALTGGIEVEIGTREDYRRKGLACICGAKLILECLERGWYPSWDAHNSESVALAEKLGYHFDHAYTAYEIMNPCTHCK